MELSSPKIKKFVKLQPQPQNFSLKKFLIFSQKNFFLLFFTKKNFILFPEMDVLAPSLKSSYIFSKKGFSYISGGNLQSLKNNNFLYFSKKVLLLINLLIFLFIRFIRIF